VKLEGEHNKGMASRRIPNRLPEISRKILVRLSGVFRENEKSEKTLKKDGKIA
jgi:hypothetical protein